MNRRMVSTTVLACLLASTAAAAGRVDTPPIPAGCESVGRGTAPATARVPGEPPFPPVQLEIRTPFEPTAFPAGGRNYLVYELHLQNFTEAPMALRGIEVFDPDSAEGRSIATLAGPGLFDKLVPIGAETLGSDPSLGSGQRAVAFLCLAFDGGSTPPNRIGHRVLLEGAVAIGPTIGTRHDPLKVLGPPVRGTDWIADNGLSITAHHRKGLVVAGGLAQISRRYAIDWKRSRDGAFFAGDARAVRSYHAYGADVVAVADAAVVLAKDGFPDNIPRTAAGFETAVPMTMETVAGNAVVLDLGDGQFAYYAHLKPGSLRVRTGDRVRRGQPLAKVGNSGDSRWPHLHFQVTNGPGILASEGIPYLIDHYRTRTASGDWESHAHEFPLGDRVIDFRVPDSAEQP